jgi:hypothetical protein
MINGMTWSVLGLMCAFSATSASAQYRRSDSDTIRVREVTTSRTALTAPTGTVELRSEHDATIALSFGRADSARAWYESLRIAMVSPQGRQEPATREALLRPFVLSFDARGRVQTLSAPEFPASFESVTELSHQFDDLLVRLPSAPLALGLMWADTAVVETRGANDAYFRGERVIRSRVVRDTMIGSETAWVIESVQRNTISGTQRVKGQPLLVRTTMSGSDSGLVVFSTQSGRMLARQRVGSLAGTVTYEGGPQPVVLPMETRYENSVRRIP